MTKINKRIHIPFCILLLAFCIYCAVGAVVALAAENTPCTSTDGCTGGYVNGICDVCNGYEQPPQGEYDIYEISNAGQLYWFAEHVNIRGNNKISGKLMADIDLENRTWYPIGVYKDAVDASGTVATVEFKGDFDGNYHTVSNFTATGNGSQGLLGYTSGDTRVTNIGVINATVSGWNAGAILGFMGSVHDSFAVNCTVTADTASEENINLVHAGVIAGTQNANVYGSFAYDCAVNASESWVNAATLAPVGGKNAYTCYYGRVTTNGNLRTSDGEVELTDQFASGELAYSLGKIWGQTLGEGGDPHPVYANGENTVYRGYLTCADTEYTYSNTEIPFSAYNLHVFTESSNGFCENCDAYEAPSYKNSTKMLEISNAGQLFWFATVTDSFSSSDRAVLVADIDLENRPWTPIGSIYEDNAFSGVFDGQNHTITGLYIEGDRAELGLFGKVRAGTVKNLTVYGEVVVKSDVDFVGGIVGIACGVDGETELERNGAIIQNVTSYVNVTVGAHGVGMIGGFVGYANHQSLIENCSWYGTFDAGVYRVDSGAGGFIGKIQENTGEVTIRNCAAYGTIKTNYEKNSFNDTPTIYMGGFLSFSDTGAGTVLENCLFAGKFERGENLTDQAFLGAFGTLRSVNSIKNCYYLGDDSLEAVHSDSNLKPGSDNVEITSVTGAQLLSGEVAYKLGEHFGQTLEGENRQSYPVLGGEAVPSSRFEIYGQQLGIGADLSMKYYVMGYSPSFNSGGLYMEFSLGGVKTKVYADEPNADGFYVFVLEGINPQCMGDNIYAMLCYNETEVARHGYEKGKEYSVEKNLLNLLEKYKDDAALVTLIKDTLAYGEAASAYKKHQTMTGNTYTENSSNREIPVSEAQVADVITGYTVRFGTAISIIIEVDPSAFGNVIYKVECNGTELRNFPSPNSPLYKVTNIAATDFDKEWEFVVRSTNPMGDVYGTVVVSVNDYLYAISQSSTDEKMVNLAKALYNYGYSAKVYDHVVNGVGEHTTVNGICTLCNENIGYDVDETTATYSVYEAEALQSVLDEASLCDGTVKLMRDLTVDADSYYSLWISSGTVILDLNGYSLTSADEVAILVAEGATLTVRDSGTSEIPGAIDALSEGIKTAGIKNEGELFVEDGIIRANTFGILNDGILTISGGSVGSKYHVAILGGEVILVGLPYLFNGSKNTSGEYLGCDFACSVIRVQATLGGEYYSYYDSDVINETQHFAEFTGYTLSTDKTYFDKVN